jgi:hypothetical protein
MQSDFHRGRTFALVYSSRDAGRTPTARWSRAARVARLIAMAAPAVCINVVIPTHPGPAPVAGVGPWRIEVCTADSSACSALHTLASPDRGCQ